MPIEIRPSDIAQAQADNFSRLFELGGAIFSATYRAETVRQVNEKLAQVAQAEEDYQRNKTTRLFQKSLGAADGAGLIGGGTQRVDFGHASEADVQADHAKYFDSLVDNISKTVTNKSARDQLMFHLGQTRVSSLGKAKKDWDVASQHASVADLGKLADTVLAGAGTWETKTAAIKSRVDAMVRTGDMWPEDGDAYVAKVQTEAQDSQAYAGALAVMKTAGTAKAGIDWLDANTPYYNANPEKREKLAETLQAKFNAFANQQDDANSSVFGDLYANADTVELVDSAMGKLGQTHYYNGTSKAVWDDRFRSKRDYLKRGGMTSAEARTARDDWFQNNESNLMGEIAIRKANGENVGSLRKIVEDVFYLKNKAGEATPLVRGKEFVVPAMAMLERPDTPAYVTAMKAFAEKTKGFKPEDSARMGNEFSAWLFANPEASDAQILAASTNITNPYIKRTVNTYFALKNQTADVAAGKFTGTALTHMTDFASYASYALKWAQAEYPDEDLRTAFPDTTGEYGHGVGAAILENKTNRAYAFKIEDGKLALYAYGLHRDGSHAWEKVTSATRTDERAKRNQEAVDAALNAGRFVYSEIIPGVK